MGGAWGRGLVQVKVGVVAHPPADEGVATNSPRQGPQSEKLESQYNQLVNPL